MQYVRRAPPPAVARRGRRGRSRGWNSRSRNRVGAPFRPSAACPPCRCHNLRVSCKSMTVPAEKPKKVAIVVHQEHSRPGRVGALLQQRGYELHRLCPNLGCELPEDMSDYAGVVIFGGPMSANDCGSLAGIKCELDWIPKVVEAGVPYLGLCLGAQLLTRALGGRVSPHPEGKVEVR